MPRPLILDLFSGAGGAAVGYERAGAAGPATHLRFLARCALWAAEEAAAPGGPSVPGGARRLVTCGCGCGNSFVEWGRAAEVRGGV